MRTVAFVSLGCAKNLVDSERMLGLLAADGLTVLPEGYDADAIVINTCGFLEASKTESMAEIHAAIALKKAGRAKRVVVAGCLVQRHKTKLLADAPGIDRLVGVFDRNHIVEAVRGRANVRQGHGHYLGQYHAISAPSDAESFKADQTVPETDAGKDDSPAARILRRQSQGKRGRRLATFEDDRGRFRLTPRHYAYLRMSEGCNQGCAFCTIPGIRGAMRSKPVEQILAEARELAADGAVEILLIGQDTTSYGTDIGYAPGLAGLLRTLVAGRWSSGTDLLGAIERLGVEALLASAQSAGELAEVEDELFRFGQVADGDLRLASALGATSVPVAQRVQLATSLLQSKARPATVRFMGSRSDT